MVFNGFAPRLVALVVNMPLTRVELSGGRVSVGLGEIRLELAVLGLSCSLSVVVEHGEVVISSSSPEE